MQLGTLGRTGREPADALSGKRGNTMTEKLTNLLMLIVAAAWLTWIVVGGNQGDVTITTYGTTIAMGVSAVAFCLKMGWRAAHGNY